ncbi:MAG: hypothetical protein GX430_14135 [Treponema sp.]|nr:hypothetical protein [Treponema sp.]
MPGAKQEFLHDLPSPFFQARSAGKDLPRLPLQTEIRGPGEEEDRGPGGHGAEEWFVVRNAKMPSVLVEVGFLTNPQDAALLADAAYLRSLGDGIYTGIVDFVDYFERRKGPSSP